MSESPRVAFVVDHPQRDLAGLVLTALDLCRHGVTCHLVPLNLQERELPALGPDFVVLNYLRRGNEGPVRALQPAEVKTAVSFRTGAYQPDFHAFETEKLIVLPWDREVIVNGELVRRPDYAEWMT